MDRHKKSDEELIVNAIEREKRKFYGDNSLERDENQIFCKKCDHHVEFKKETITSRIKEHYKSKEHQRNKSKSSSTLITSLSNKQQQESKEDEFKNDLLDWCVSADIPLHKLKMESTIEFMKSTFLITRYPIHRLSAIECINELLIRLR